MSDFSFIDLESAPRVPFNLDGRVLFSRPGYELVHLTLRAGEAMELHVQPFDVTFFITGGTGILSVENEVIPGIPGRTIHVSAGVKRAWANTGDEPLTILVNKFPD
jgi:quercetin dioxygenase-like cupin family protein